MLCSKRNCYRRTVIALALVIITASFGASEAAAPWSFAVLGDQRDNDGTIGVNTPVIVSMVKDIVENRGVSLVLAGGDQIHGVSGPDEASLPTMYKHWRTAMGRQLLRVLYPVRGNHEIAGEKSAPLYPYFWRKCVVSLLPQIPQNGPTGEKGMTYSFSRQGAFFVALDHFVPGNENRLNQSWLDQQLSANILPHLFVFGHEPAVALDPILPNLASYPLQRDAFWETLSDGGAQVYFSGHHHLYNRTTVTITDVNGRTTNPISQMVVGSGGAPFESWSTDYPPPCHSGFCPYLTNAGQPIPPSPESVTAQLNSHLEDQYGYAIVTVNGSQVSIVYYAGTPAGGGVPTAWVPFDTFSYTVDSKTLGLKDMDQAIDPQTLSDFYPGIAINKVGAGTLTLNAGTSSYSGPIAISAGKISVNGTYADAPVSVKYGGQATLHGGSLNDVTVDEGGILVGSGTVRNVTNAGLICPDLMTGPWDLTVTGNYAQTTTGSLNLDIASASTYGRVHVDGDVTLDGALFVSMPSGYPATVGQTFPNVITAGGSLTGNFSRIVVSPPDTALQTTQNGNSLSLEVVSASR